MLAIVEARADHDGVRNVEPVLGTERDPNLPDASVDVSLLVDAYHEFAYPREMLAALFRATRARRARRARRVPRRGPERARSASCTR